MTGGGHFVEITLKLLHTEKSFLSDQHDDEHKKQKDISAQGLKGKHIYHSNTLEIERAIEEERESDWERERRDERMRACMSWQVEENQLLRGTY